MKDVLHIPAFEDDHFICEECGAVLPSEACLVSAYIIESPGLGMMPATSTDAKRAVSCSSTMGKKLVDKAANGDFIVELEEVERTGDEVVMPKATEFEKTVARQSFNNFLRMREMTRPE